MEVPREILVLLSNTQALDQSLRTTAEERLKFFEQNELGKLSLRPTKRNLLTRPEFPLLLTSIAVEEKNDRLLRQVSTLREYAKNSLR